MHFMRSIVQYCGIGRHRTLRGPGRDRAIACSLVRSRARSISKHGTPRRHDAAALASPLARAKQDSDFFRDVACAIQKTLKEDSRDRRCSGCMHHISMYDVRSAGSPEDELYKARTYAVIDELILAFFARGSRIEDRGSPVGCLQKDRRTEAFRIPYSETRIPSRAIGSRVSVVCAVRAAR